MPNYGEQTWPTEYIPKIRDRIVSEVKSGLTVDRVFASGLDDQDLIDWSPADQFITLWQPRFPVDQKRVTGAGAYNTAFDSHLITKLFVRFEGDIETRSTAWIESTVYGPLALAQKVMTALQTWEGPIAPAGGGLHLFRYPMRSLGFDVTKGRGKTKDQSRWGVVAMNWEVSFVAAIGSNYPGTS